MGFAEDLRKLCERSVDKAELVVRKTALELQTGMVQKSPVDTGRFRANWACGIGVINTSTAAAPDKTGQGAIVKTAVDLGAWKPGMTIWLTNSLPYASRLETGYSKQAPSGMVALTVQAYGDALKRAVESIK